MKNKQLLSVATVGPLGYFPASGTCGSLVGLVLVGLMHYFLDVKTQAWCIGLFVVAGFFIIKKTLHYFSSCDPREIIIDEVIGCTVAFYGLSLTIHSTILCFLLFRFFDITKIGGIWYIERVCKGSWGILLDDIVAALFANILMRVI